MALVPTAGLADLDFDVDLDYYCSDRHHLVGPCRRHESYGLLDPHGPHVEGQTLGQQSSVGPGIPGLEGKKRSTPAPMRHLLQPLPLEQ